MSKNKRPRNFKLTDDFTLRVSHKGVPLLYLKDESIDENSGFRYIEKRRKLLALKNWLEKALIFSGVK